MFEESSDTYYAMFALVGLEGSEGTTLQEPDTASDESHRYPSEMVLQRLPEINYKKLAGLESERQFSFLEVCDD